LALASTALAACGAGSGESTAAKDCTPAHEGVTTIREGDLTVASYDLPPFLKVEGAKLTGIDGEILTEIAKMECLTIKPMPVDPAAVIPTVQSKRADVAAGDWYRTKDRAEVVTLSDPVYLDQMALISKEGVSAIPDLKGMKVGTVSGSLWVDDMKAYLGGGLVLYSSFPNMYQDLASGRIDVGVDGMGSGVHSAAKGLKVVPVEPFEEVGASLQAGQTNFPTKNNEALAKAINDDVAKLREDGTLADILKSNGLDPSAAEVGEPRLL
jgi:polar amino acid transport system substrate-binding protein